MRAKSNGVQPVTKVFGAPPQKARRDHGPGIRPIYFYAGFTALLATNILTLVGFLMAPVAYEVVRSRYVQLDQNFDPAYVNKLFAEMRAEAEAVVKAGAPEAKLIETRTAEKVATASTSVPPAVASEEMVCQSATEQTLERRRRERVAIGGRTRMRQPRRPV